MNAWALIPAAGKGERAGFRINKVFVQGLWAAGSNIVTTAIVGTILCAAYSASKPKKDSLEKKA